VTAKLFLTDFLNLVNNINEAFNAIFFYFLVQKRAEAQREIM
jgi:hypothetical protein